MRAQLLQPGLALCSQYGRQTGRCPCRKRHPGSAMLRFAAVANRQPGEVRLISCLDVGPGRHLSGQGG